MNFSVRRKRSSTTSRVLLGLSLAGLLAGCTDASVGSTSLPPSSSSTAVPLSSYSPERVRHEGGTLVIGDWESPTNLAPMFNQELPAAEIDAALYAGLTRLDAQLHWAPDLAERVPTLENGDVSWNRAAHTMDVSYRLRAGLRWSDGQPITARDVAFTWRALVDPHAQGYLDTTGYQAISRIDIRDDLHLTLHFERVYPEYLTLFPAVLPEHRLRDVAFSQLPTDAFWVRPDVVSGPYKVSEVVPDEHITLVRNLTWSQGRGDARPHLDTIIYKVYPEAGQLIDAARKGEVALALEIPDGELSGLGNLNKVSLMHRASLAYEQVTFNQADPNPLTGQPPVWKGDPVLLRALRIGVDREALDRTLLGGQAELADSPIPSALTQYRSPDPAPAFDSRQAAQLLDSDGWVVGPDGVRVKAGRRLSFSLTTALGDPLRLAVRDRLIADWRRIGVQVLPSDAHPSQLFAGYAEGGLLEHGSFEAGLWTWSIGPDPDGVYALEHSSEIPTDRNQGQGSNFGRFASQNIDESLERGRGSLLAGQRVQAYSAFERAYNDLGAELPLYQRVLSVLASPHLHNVLPNPAPDTTFWNVADWWVDP